MAYESVKKNNSSWNPAHQPARENPFAPRPYNPQPEQEKEVTAQSAPHSRDTYDTITSKICTTPNPTIQTKTALQPSQPESEPDEKEQESESTEKLSSLDNPESPKNRHPNFLDEQSPIQTKLTIGEPGDKYEQEADTVAKQVMSMSQQTESQHQAPENSIQTKPFAHTINPLIQRQLELHQKRHQSKPIRTSINPLIQRQRELHQQQYQLKPITASINPLIQRFEQSAQSNYSSPGNSSLESRLNSEKGSGSPLDNQTRTFMESRFGDSYDFSKVRVHTDSTAVQMNKELGSQAFAFHTDIFYGQGKSPGKNELTAHELTHVVQQGGAKPLNQKVQAKPQPETANPNKEIRLFPEAQTSPAKQIPEQTTSLTTNKESKPLHQKIENYNSNTPIQTKQLNTQNILQRQPLNISSVSPRIQGVFTWAIEQALGSRVVEMLQRAGNVLGRIIQDPVGFLGNLVAAIRNGFTKFQQNIGTHLTNGLMGWLFGALSGSGLILPSAFDAKGLLSITLQVLGITYNNLRGRLTRRLGDERVNRLEQSYDFLQKIASGGLTEAWEDICQEVGDMKDMILGGIKDWVINTIITKAITKLISMFNPVGGLIEAAKGIYNTVMFFIERAQQIAALVDSIFNSIGKIVAGDTDSASSYIEQAMGRTIPVMISFFARLLGLGGISDRIKAVIQRIQSPINRALDKLEQKIADRARTLLDGNQGQNQAQRPGSATPVTSPAPQSQPPSSSTSSTRQNTSNPATPPAQQSTSSPATTPTRSQTPTSQQNQSAQQNTSSDTANHRDIARQAASELKQMRGDKKDYEAIRQDKEAQARQIEQKYTRRLSSGIKLTVRFEEAIQDQKDGDLDFEIKIAPNDTVLKDEIPTDILGKDEGTESNPIPLDWPKPASAEYRVLYFGGKANQIKKQKYLEKKVGQKDETGTEIKAYKPDKQVALPGGEIIGISDKYEIKIGKLVGPLSTSQTPGGEKINRVLKRYGFDPSEEGTDGDHVQEIQLGGQDALPNLWPLNQGTNRGAGSKLSQTTVQGPNSRKSAKISTLKEDKSRKYYFKIKSVTSKGTA